MRTSDMARYPLNLGMIFISEKKRRRVFARGIFIGYIVNFAHIRAGVVIDGDIFVFLRRTQLFHERERYPVRTMMKTVFLSGFAAIISSACAALTA